MKFISQHILSSDERLIYATRLHWIYIIVGMFWAAAFIGIGLFINWAMLKYAGITAHTFRASILDYDLGPVYLWITGAFIGTGVGLFLMHVIKVWSTELVLTTSRMIYKTGWLMVDVEEMSLSEIEAENVRHGLLGAILGYGSISMDCRFVGDVSLPAIRNPYKFLRILHKARSQATTHAPPVIPS